MNIKAKSKLIPYKSYIQYPIWQNYWKLVMKIFLQLFEMINFGMRFVYIY